MGISNLSDLHIKDGAYEYDGPENLKSIEKIKTFFLRHCSDNAERRWEKIVPLIKMYLRREILGMTIEIGSSLTASKIYFFEGDYEYIALQEKQFPPSWEEWVKKERKRKIPKEINRLHKKISALDKLLKTE